MTPKSGKSCSPDYGRLAERLRGRGSDSLSRPRYASASLRRCCSYQARIARSSLCRQRNAKSLSPSGTNRQPMRWAISSIWATSRSISASVIAIANHLPRLRAFFGSDSLPAPCGPKLAASASAARGRIQDHRLADRQRGTSHRAERARFSPIVSVEPASP